MKKTILIFFLILASFICFANSQKEVKQSPFVASTSWVASIAELAGVDDVLCIAPSNLKHPPEYEITASDIVNVSKATLFMHAGYEAMMKTISEASEIDKSKVIKVKTTNTLSNLSNMVNLVSQKAGTEQEGKKRFSEYTKLIEDARIKIKETGLDKIEIFVNSNQAEFARDLGLNVVSTFGPGSLSSDEIAQAAIKKYRLVIDNYHNPVASPIKEVSPDSVILEWKNFPDKLGNNALFNLIKDNIELLFNTVK